MVGYIKSGIAEGAHIAAGGPDSGVERGYFVRPTVLTNTNPGMKVVEEEIFGPVVCAVPFSDDDVEQIVKRANDTIYGLAASVWTAEHQPGPQSSPRACVPARCGSTATTSLTPRSPSADTNNPAGAVKWAQKSSTTTLKSKRSL